MKRVVAAAEIGGTKLQLALVTPEGEVLAVHRGRAPEGGADPILAWFAAETPAFLARAAEFDAEVATIGIGYGGPVDTSTGRVFASFQVSGWRDRPLQAWFEELTGLPAVLHNDSNAAGWAEYRAGAGRGTRSFFYTNIGSGIGGAIILNGALYNGQGLGAGEMGHTWVPDFTRTDVPGAAEKVENLCSGWSIERRLRARGALPEGSPLDRACEGRPERITCAMLGPAARAGDAIALAEIEQVAGTIAIALANVITLFQPERVAVGGGVALLGDVLLEPLRRRVAELVFDPCRGRYEIVPCALGEAVVLVGAALLAAEAQGIG